MRAVFVAVWMMVLAGCSGPYSNPSVAAKEGARPLEVKIHRVALESIPEVISATGELFAEDLATVGAKVPGRIAKLHVDLGSVVQAGQPLAEIEQVEYEYRVKQVEAQVEQSRARLGLAAGASDDIKPAETALVREAAATLDDARITFQRTTELFGQGVLSRMEHDRAQANLRLAEAKHQAAMEQVLQARAELLERRTQLAMARYQLIETVIRAPFPGAVTRRLATKGEYLQVNAPVVTIVRSNPMRLRLEVPERLAAKVRLGQRVDVQVEGSGVPPGRVVRLSPAIEAQNRSLIVEAEIANERGVLRPGSFAEGSITVDANARGLAAPGKAVVSFAGVDRVFVSENGVLAERIVRLGRKLSGERVEILAGLNSGDLVVAQANDRLMVGQKIMGR